MRSKKALLLATLVGLATLFWVSATQLGDRLSSPSMVLASRAQSFVRGDLDGDGVLDESHVAASDRIGVQLSSVRPAQVTLTAPDRIIGIADVDVDGDGDLDLVASLAGGGVAVWINQGHGTFERAPQKSSSAPVVVSSTIVSTYFLGTVSVITRVVAWLVPPAALAGPLEPVECALTAASTTPRTTVDSNRPVRAPPSASL